MVGTTMLFLSEDVYKPKRARVPYGSTVVIDAVDGDEVWFTFVDTQLTGLRGYTVRPNMFADDNAVNANFVESHRYHRERARVAEHAASRMREAVESGIFNSPPSWTGKDRVDPHAETNSETWEKLD